jgi:2-C-methyl-D-erythritol 2,4-cyclodiphosphate synthase
VFRIGFGYDIHRLVESRALVLGGVRIPYTFGLLGHSDADALTHAVIDGILGALGKGDIGLHFPDNDPANKDLDSMIMLVQVMGWAEEEGYRINNIDTTIVAERPRLAPFIPDMKENLARVMGTRSDRISIKAKTAEGLGPCGRQEGIEAYSVVSLIGSSTR